MTKEDLEIENQSLKLFIKSCIDVLQDPKHRKLKESLQQRLYEIASRIPREQKDLRDEMKRAMDYFSSEPGTVSWPD